MRGRGVSVMGCNLGPTWKVTGEETSIKGLWNVEDLSGSQLVGISSLPAT